MYHARNRHRELRPSKFQQSDQRQILHSPIKAVTMLYITAEAPPEAPAEIDHITGMMHTVIEAQQG